MLNDCWLTFFDAISAAWIEFEITVHTSGGYTFRSAHTVMVFRYGSLSDKHEIHQWIRGMTSVKTPNRKRGSLYEWETYQKMATPKLCVPVLNHSKHKTYSSGSLYQSPRKNPLKISNTASPDADPVQIGFGNLYHNLGTHRLMKLTSTARLSYVRRMQQ